MRKILGSLIAVGLVTTLMSGGTAQATPAAAHIAVCDIGTDSAYQYYARIKGVTDGWVISHAVFNYFLESSLWHQDYCMIGKSKLIIQIDGNLVLYDENGHPRWHSATYGVREQRGRTADFQPDGNFVVYGADWPRNVLWRSDTCCSHTRVLAVQADGNVVVYETYGSENSYDWRALWATNTNH